MGWCRVVGPRGLCRPLDEKQATNKQPGPSRPVRAILDVLTQGRAGQGTGQGRGQKGKGQGAGAGGREGSRGGGRVQGAGGRAAVIMYRRCSDSNLHVYSSGTSLSTAVWKTYRTATALYFMLLLCLSVYLYIHIKTCVHACMCACMHAGREVARQEAGVPGNKP